MKQLWSYIRENNLQDPSNRRNILCDDKLHDLFGVDTINMFQMNKALAKHIWPLESNGGNVSIMLDLYYFERLIFHLTIVLAANSLLVCGNFSF